MRLECLLALLLRRAIFVVLWWVDGRRAGDAAGEAAAQAESAAEHGQREKEARDQGDDDGFNGVGFTTDIQLSMPNLKGKLSFVGICFCWSQATKSVKRRRRCDM